MIQYRIYTNLINMKIYYDKQAEQLFKLKLKQKKNTLNEAVKIASEFIKIESMEEFNKDFFKYTITNLKLKLGLPHINNNKLAELTELPITRLQILQTNFNRNKIDIEAQLPDFGIYATNEIQINTFKNLQLLCDQLNKWNPTNTFQIEIAFSNKIINSGSGFIPSYHYIKSL